MAKSPRTSIHVQQCYVGNYFLVESPKMFSAIVFDLVISQIFLHGNCSNVRVGRLKID